jgi:hypothetical protein
MLSIHIIHETTWHISGTIKIKKIYNKVSKSGKVYIYYREERDGIIHICTKDEAIHVLRNSMIQKYERMDPSLDFHIFHLL